MHKTYEGAELLNVDIYQVGHHGSYNGTTDSFLEAMSPQAAIICVGKWNDGMLSPGRARPFTTYAYGHPRLSTLSMLSRWIPGYRSTPKTVKAAAGVHDFENYRVTKRIYATGWDKTIQVRATEDREYRITVGHDEP